MANVQENMILHYKIFYFCKICPETYSHSDVKLIRFEIGPVVFAPRTRTNATDY
jgi:hypothetical protein